MHARRVILVSQVVRRALEMQPRDLRRYLQLPRIQAQLPEPFDHDTVSCVLAYGIVIVFHVYIFCVFYLDSPSHFSSSRLLGM